MGLALGGEGWGREEVREGGTSTRDQGEGRGAGGGVRWGGWLGVGGVVWVCEWERAGERRDEESGKVEGKERVVVSSSSEVSLFSEIQ